MARSSTKQLAKMRMARVWLNLDKVASQFATLYDVFAPHHPEQAKQLEAMGQATLILQSMVEDFWQSVWGELPANWETWT